MESGVRPCFPRTLGGIVTQERRIGAWPRPIRYYNRLQPPLDFMAWCLKPSEVPVHSLIEQTVVEHLLCARPVLYTKDTAESKTNQIQGRRYHLCPLFGSVSGL